MALVIPAENNMVIKKECRICFENDTIDNLIWPCNCDGSIKYVHEDCLIKWIKITSNDEYKKNCSICKTPYLIRYQNKKEYINLNLILDIPNICMEFFFIEILIVVLTCVIPIIDSKTNAYSTRLLSFNLYSTDKLDNTIKHLYNVSSDSQYRDFGKDMAVFFYFNYAHYIFYLFAYIFFCYYTFCNLHKKHYYFNIVKYKLLLIFLYYNAFFICFNLLMWGDSKEIVVFFNIFMTVISFLNFLMFKALVILHNDTIKKINNKFFKIRIYSVEKNPLLMV